VPTPRGSSVSRECHRRPRPRVTHRPHHAAPRASARPRPGPEKESILSGSSRAPH